MNRLAHLYWKLEMMIEMAPTTPDLDYDMELNNLMLEIAAIEIEEKYPVAS